MGSWLGVWGHCFERAPGDWRGWEDLQGAIATHLKRTAELDRHVQVQLCCLTEALPGDACSL